LSKINSRASYQSKAVLLNVSLFRKYSTTDAFTSAYFSSTVRNRVAGAREYCEQISSMLPWR